MFEVRPDEEKKWVIIDGDDERVYAGTWRECEDWLDVHENAGKQSAKNGSFPVRFRRLLGRIRTAVTRFRSGVHPHSGPSAKASDGRRS